VVILRERNDRGSYQDANPSLHELLTSGNDKQQNLFSRGGGEDGETSRTALLKKASNPLFSASSAPPRETMRFRSSVVTS
jgi:hypothetical protein